MANHRIHHHSVVHTSSEHYPATNTLGLLSITLLLLAVTVWSYWPTISDLMKDWHSDDDYSGGQLVPFVAVILVWRERKAIGTYLLKPFWAGGIALLVLAQAARIFGLLFMYESAERYSLVLTIGSLVLMVAGRRVFWRVSWILLFLFLMVPFPGRVHNVISRPLRAMASAGSVFVLEAFIDVGRHGNVLMLNGDTTVGVAEACSGLRMLTAFIIVAAFITYVVKRSRLQKTVLLVSSIPVAILCNILRIVVTAVLMLLVNAEVAEKFFHDFAGLVMMPAAVLIMFGELWLMDRLVMPDSEPLRIHRRARAKATASQAPARRMETVEQPA